MQAITKASIPALRNIATRLRIDSIRSTSEAGSGHPTTCMSAAEIVATLFFAEMRFDPKNPQHPDADRFVLSKGHGAPLLYAAWAEAGAFDRAELLRLRKLDSDLEGHPTPRLPFVDVATGSLGQGLAAGVGIALNARLIGSDYRTYVLMGDGESSEGAVWEAAQAATNFKLDSICAITDVNRLGQSRATQFGHDLAEFERRWHAFGWYVVKVDDGHDVRKLLRAFAKARANRGRPTMILARTLKGKGVTGRKLRGFTGKGVKLEDQNGWHGKPLKKGEEADRAIAELETQLVPEDGPRPSIRRPSNHTRPPVAPDYTTLPPPAYKPGDNVATREAWGAALTILGAVDPRIVVLDADVGNSTFSEKFEKRFEKEDPKRFFQHFIAEQGMIGTAMGLASRGLIPFPSSFACFLERAADFIRMAGISNINATLNVKMAGSHAGVSIGEDGPSQMALEDLAMMRAVPNCTVLYPCDAVSTERLVVEMAATRGLAYMRTSRPKTRVIYDAQERFPIGGSKVLRRSARDVATVVGAGVTVFEALQAHDALRPEGLSIRVIDAYSVQPIDAATLVAAGKATGGIIVTVEDHYAAGGLGDAVSEAVADHAFIVHRLAVREVPRSGAPGELLDKYGISARHIVAAVKRLAVRSAGL